MPILEPKKAPLPVNKTAAPSDAFFPDIDPSAEEGEESKGRWRIDHKKLREAIEASEKSLSQLSDICAIPKSTLQRWTAKNVTPSNGEDLSQLTQALRVRISDILLDDRKDDQDMEDIAQSLESGGENSSLFRENTFNVNSTFTRLLTISQTLGLTETYKALYFVKQKHKDHFLWAMEEGEEKIPHLIHPLIMACHACALGIHDDQILATILLHDIEDFGVDIETLDFSEPILTALRLLKRENHGKGNKSRTKSEYYAAISGNTIATIVKVLDRCNNLSNISRSCLMDEKHKILSYTRETEEYALPLLTVLKQDIRYGNFAFVVKYQTKSLIDTIRALL